VLRHRIALLLLLFPGMCLLYLQPAYLLAGLIGELQQLEWYWYGVPKSSYFCSCEESPRPQLSLAFHSPTITVTQHGAYLSNYHSRASQVDRQPRCLNVRGLGHPRRVQWARRGVAADGGVWGGVRGVEGVDRYPPSAGGVRWVRIGEWEKLGQRDWSERGVGATVRAISGDDAMEV